ncbi:19870_t:CDS:2, partial [Dentiscutata erythropus]
KKCFSSYKNLREVLQKHEIDNDEVHSILVFFPNCENEENYKGVFEDCIKEIKARLSAIGNMGDQDEFEIIGDVFAGRVDYAIKKIYPQLTGSGFEEIICVTEAKQIDIKVGVAQNLIQLEGSLDSNKNKKRKLDDLYPDQAYSEYVYGIVSTGTDWYFLKHTPGQIFCSQASDYIPLVTTQLNNDEDLRKGIKTVLELCSEKARPKVPLEQNSKSVLIQPEETKVSHDYIVAYPSHNQAQSIISSEINIMTEHQPCDPGSHPHVTKTKNDSIQKDS